MKSVSVIGHGRIGRTVVQGIERLADLQVVAVLTRTPIDGLTGNTTTADQFFSQSVDLIIDAAGPGALRQFGLEALSRAPVWSVGAVALADVTFRREMEQIRSKTGHELRLFANGMAWEELPANSLRITMRRPGFGGPWCGPLADAVARFPDDLNTAVAAALCGPGLEHTRLNLEDSGSGGIHQIRIEGEHPVASWQRAIQFPRPDQDPHPVAAMILGALDHTSFLKA